MRLEDENERVRNDSQSLTLNDLAFATRDVSYPSLYNQFNEEPVLVSSFGE